MTAVKLVHKISYQHVHCTVIRPRSHVQFHIVIRFAKKNTSWTYSISVYLTVSQPPSKYKNKGLKIYSIKQYGHLVFYYIFARFFCLLFLQHYYISIEFFKYPYK